MKSFKSLFIILLITLLYHCSTQPNVKISGEMKVWHRVALTFEGPMTSEGDSVNPFLDYRLDVRFKNGSHEYSIPGFYAADGNAGNSGESSGNKWRVYFTPDTTGVWHYKVDFIQAKNIAIAEDNDSGNPSAFNGSEGEIEIKDSDKDANDFRKQGMLRYNGDHYLIFAGSGEAFLKGGADSPENFLGYFEFDQTKGTHKYNPHARDWHNGDPVWKGEKGKNIIGALNYLASKKMNSVYMLLCNLYGDGKDVWPWSSKDERYRFDCSKLDQWEVVYSHMDSLGIMAHFLFSEAENSNMFEFEELGLHSEGFANSRKLFYREMVARFSHHLAITWNLGEENNMVPDYEVEDTNRSDPNTDKQRKQFASYIRKLDPYDHMIVVHNADWIIFPPLYNFPAIEGPSMQVHNPDESYDKTNYYRTESARTGKKWVVCVDEIGHFSTGAMPDEADADHDKIRKDVLWANLMAGGAGVEWYFGYKYPHADLNCEDWRSRDALWDQTRYALEFFHKYTNFTEMVPDNDIISTKNGWCFSQPGQQYVIYLKNGGSTNITLDDGKIYEIYWYNPRKGGKVQYGSIKEITGTGSISIGLPPSKHTKDWAVLLISNF